MQSAVGKMEVGAKPAFQVEAYISGHPYKIARFENWESAQAYQNELHRAGHYYVPIIDLRAASSRDQFGTRIDWPIDKQSQFLNAAR